MIEDEANTPQKKNWSQKHHPALWVTEKWHIVNTIYRILHISHDDIKRSITVTGGLKKNAICKAMLSLIRGHFRHNNLVTDVWWVKLREDFWSCDKHQLLPSLSPVLGLFGNVSMYSSSSVATRGGIGVFLFSWWLRSWSSPATTLGCTVNNMYPGAKTNVSICGDLVHSETSLSEKPK